MSWLRSVLILVVSVLFCISQVHAKPTVIASIKPIHSLVAGMMKGIADPILLLEAGSPHTYALKPSQAKQLQDYLLITYGKL